MNHRQALFFIVGLVPITGVGIDIYLPSMPDMVTFFSTTPTAMRSSISLYLVGYGLGQLFFGFLADRFGRRPVLLSSLVGFILTCTSIMLSKGIETFLALRLLQGIMVAGPGIVTKSLISDCFEGKRLAKASNAMTISWALGPILAPVVGSYAHTLWGWQSTFGILNLYAFSWLVIAFFQIQNASVAEDKPSINSLIKYAKLMLKTPRFWCGICLLNCAYATMTTFNALGPFLLENKIGLSEIEFGYCALLLGIAWFLGNIFNRVLLIWYTNTEIIKLLTFFGILIFSISSLLSLVLPLTTLTVLVLVSISYIWGGVTLTNGFTLIYSEFKESSGVVNALTGALFMLGSALIALSTGMLENISHLHLSVTHLAAALPCGVVVYIINSTRK